MAKHFGAQSPNQWNDFHDFKYLAQNFSSSIDAKFQDFSFKDKVIIKSNQIFIQIDN